MAAVLEKKLFTYDDITALPEGQYEIIDGVRKDMTPTGGVHSKLEYQISRLLGDHYGAGYHILVGEVGILIKKSPLRVRAADIACISKEKMDKVPLGILETAPALVVEIVSESNAHWELTDKVKGLFRHRRGAGRCRGSDNRYRECLPAGRERNSFSWF
jgi:Uma2 family endonuclease